MRTIACNNPKPEEAESIEGVAICSIFVLTFSHQEKMHGLRDHESNEQREEI